MLGLCIQIPCGGEAHKRAKWLVSSSILQASRVLLLLFLEFNSMGKDRFLKWQFIFSDITFLVFFKPVLLRYTSHNIQFTHLKGTQVNGFESIRRSVRLSPQSILEGFHYHRKRPYTLQLSLSYPSIAPSPWHPLIYFLSPWICLFWPFK